MTNKLRNRTRALFSRFFPAQHTWKIPSFNDNVHDLSRIGGVSVLCLPPEFAPGDLVIPTRFAATAQFLVNIGLCSGNSERRLKSSDDSVLRKWTGYDIPGLFRIPGSKITTERLRAYFAGQMLDGCEVMEARRCSKDIEFTVRLGILPSQNVIPYQVHDVASAFKSFFSDLDGGILGSVEVFEGLRKVVLPPVRKKKKKSRESLELDFRCVGIDDGNGDEEDPIDARLIARVLCTIECAASRNLVLAVFGLLAFFKAPEPRHSRAFTDRTGRHSIDPAASMHEQVEHMRGFCFPVVPPEARMTSESLGKIFAPILLGENQTNQIKMETFTQIGITSRKWTPSPLKRRGSPTKRTVRRPNNRFSTLSEKTNITINIATRPTTAPRASAYIEQDKENRRFSYLAGKIGSTPSFFRSRASLPTMRLSEKQKKASKSTAEFYDLQDRIMLMARVISQTIRHWEEVVIALREMGYVGRIGVVREDGGYGGDEGIAMNGSSEDELLRAYGLSEDALIETQDARSRIHGTLNRMRRDEWQGSSRPWHAYTRSRSKAYLGQGVLESKEREQREREEMAREYRDWELRDSEGHFVRDGQLRQGRGERSGVRRTRRDGEVLDL